MGTGAEKCSLSQNVPFKSNRGGCRWHFFFFSATPGRRKVLHDRPTVAVAFLQSRQNGREKENQRKRGRRARARGDDVYVSCSPPGPPRARGHAGSLSVRGKEKTGCKKTAKRESEPDPLFCAPDPPSRRCAAARRTVGSRVALARATLTKSEGESARGAGPKVSKGAGEAASREGSAGVAVALSLSSLQLSSLKSLRRAEAGETRLRCSLWQRPSAVGDSVAVGSHLYFEFGSPRTGTRRVFALARGRHSLESGGKTRQNGTGPAGCQRCQRCQR